MSNFDQGGLETSVLSLPLVKIHRFGQMYIGQIRYFSMILPLAHLLLTYFGTFALVFTISVFRGMTNISNQPQFSSLSGTLDGNLLKIAQKCAQRLSFIGLLQKNGSKLMLFVSIT